MELKEQVLMENNLTKATVKTLYGTIDGYGITDTNNVSADKQIEVAEQGTSDIYAESSLTAVFSYNGSLSFDLIGPIVIGVSPNYTWKQHIIHRTWYYGLTKYYAAK